MRATYISLVFGSLISLPAGAVGSANLPSGDPQACADRAKAYSDMKKDDFSGLDAACQEEVSKVANASADRSCFKDALNDSAAVSKVVDADGTMGGTGMNTAYQASYFANQTQRNNCENFISSVNSACTTTKPQSVLNALDLYSRCSAYRMTSSVSGASTSSGVANATAAKGYQQQAGLVKTCFLVMGVCSGLASPASDVYNGRAPAAQWDDMSTQELEAPAANAVNPYKIQRPGGSPPPTQ